MKLGMSVSLLFVCSTTTLSVIFRGEEELAAIDAVLMLF